NNALDGLGFTPALNFNGLATLTVASNDLGNFGSGGALTTTSSINVTVNPVNDAPTNSVPPAQTVNEDTLLVFSAANSNAITVNDVDDLDNVIAGHQTMQITLTATNGVLTLSGTTGLVFTVGTGTNDATMTFSGTIANIDAALDGLGYLPTANYNGPAQLSI